MALTRSMPPSALLRSATLLVLAVGTQGRPTLDVRPERTLSASRHEEDVGMEGVRKHAALAHAVSLAREREQSTFDSSSSADSALRKAIEAGELEALMDAIHENADTASPKVLDEARALRDTLREAKNLPETLSKSNAASSADAALHEAMESGELNAIMDAIHANAETASPEVLEDARTLRDSLREAKHASEGTASAEDPAPETTEEVAESEGTPEEAEAEEEGEGTAEEGEEVEEGEVAAKEEDICPRPKKWCNYVGATNEPTRCDKVPGHYCTDIFGKSGFWPCDTKINATWGVGIECIRPEKPAQAVATPVPAAWADAADADSAAEAASDAAQQADEACLLGRPLTSKRASPRL